MNDKIVTYCQVTDFKRLRDFDNNFEHIEKYKNGFLEVEKFYCNDEKINIDIDNRGLIIKFNPSKMNGILFGLSDFPSIKKAIDEAKEITYSKGIDVNWKEVKVVRYDNAYDLDINRCYDDYAPLFNTVLTGQSLRKGRNRIYESTLYVGNKSKQISIYDKGKEIGCNENVMRLEFRNKRIRNKFKLSDINENEYWKLRSKDKNEIRRVIFNRVENVINDELSYIINLINSDLKLNEVFKKIACLTLRKNIEAIKPLLEVKRSQNNYQRLYRVKRALEKNLIADSNIIDLYIEVKEKFERVT